MPSLTAKDIFDLEATALPVAFDIVWCKFPYRQFGNAPGPVARPCLVRKPYTHVTRIEGKDYLVGYVDTIYGTKQIDKFVPPRGFLIENDDEKKVCGLKVDTVFDLKDHAILPWSPIYFSNENGKAIISGHFSEAMKLRLREQFKLLKP